MIRWRSGPTRRPRVPRYDLPVEEEPAVRYEDDAHPWAWPTLIVAVGVGLIGVLMLV